VEPALIPKRLAVATQAWQQRAIVREANAAAARPPKPSACFSDHSKRTDLQLMGPRGGAPKGTSRFSDGKEFDSELAWQADVALVRAEAEANKAARSTTGSDVNRSQQLWAASVRSRNSPCSSSTGGGGHPGSAKPHRAWAAASQG
jgi:hypothetical protein